jgi:cation transport ATPase
MTQGTMERAGAQRKTTLIITVVADEIQGLHALAKLEGAVTGRRADVEETAGKLLHAALKTGLEEVRLGWSPSDEDISKRVAEAARPASGLARLARTPRVRRYFVSALAVALLIALWGGYIDRWNWTGFETNDQLWAWLHLLLLPAVVGTVPLWFRRAGTFTRRRRVAGLLATAAIAIFVAVAYAVPLAWTGFAGNTLWNWFGLLLLPVAVASVRFLPSVLRSLRTAHRWGIGAVALAWALTIVGGYAWRWTWTGYEGNTLWDWMQLLLMPLIVPTIVLPTALKWASDKAR